MMHNPEPEEEEEVREEIVPGVARALSPMVRRILALNPGVRTGLGTNTYLVGIDEIAVIDPGPNEKSHLDSICGCGGDLIRWILITNDDAHHAEAVVELKKRTGAVVMAMHDIEGRDKALADGDQIVGTEFRLTAKHLKGQGPKNLGFMLEEERCLFTGDLILEGSSAAVMPPNGDMAAYLESLESLKKIRLKRLAPAHGYILEEPKVTIQEYIDHRLEREKDILKALGSETMRVEDLVEPVYGELDDETRELAEGTILAHLIKLRSDGAVKGQKNFTKT